MIVILFFGSVAARAYDQQLLLWFGEDPKINEFLNFPQHKPEVFFENFSNIL